MASTGKEQAIMATDEERSPSWDEPILVRTLHPDDGYPCGVAGGCDEPAEWSVELAGLDSREDEPEDDAPHADACMAHLGWVAGALLPKTAPVSNIVLVGEDGHRFVNGEGNCFVCGDQAEDHEPLSTDASSQSRD